MLIDKYLPAYHFREYHSVRVANMHDDIYASHAWLVKFLFRLRGRRTNIYTIPQLPQMGFTKLGEDPGKEILFGMVTHSPTFSSCKTQVSTSSFTSLSNPSIIKAVINFSVKGVSKKIKLRFRLYWFFIKPFSGLIRMAILREVKKQLSR